MLIKYVFDASTHGLVPSASNRAFMLLLIFSTKNLFSSDDSFKVHHCLQNWHVMLFAIFAFADLVHSNLDLCSHSCSDPSGICFLLVTRILGCEPNSSGSNCSEHSLKMRTETRKPMQLHHFIKIGQR